METFLKRLSAYVAEHPPDLQATDADSILEAIYWVYCESNSMDSDAIRADLETLHNMVQSHSASEIDMVFDVVCSLCEEHKRVAFSEGIKFGVRLEQELVLKQKAPPSY